MAGRIICTALLALLTATTEATAQTVTRAFLRTDLASPQQFDTHKWITFTASADGGLAPHEFKWWLWDGTAWRVVQDWTLRPVFYWYPPGPGDYMIAVWVRGNGSAVNAAQALAQLRYQITPFVFGAVPTIQIVFTRNGGPFYVNAQIILEAWVTGGYETELKWVFWDGQRWTMLRDWERDELFVWTPSAPGAYRLAVWVRNGNITADAPQILRELIIDVLPPGGIPRATQVSFQSDLPSPQAAGTPITFSAFSAVGQHPHEYKWWLWDGITWSVLAEWNRSASVTWTPTRAGRYTILAWVRTQGTTVHPSQPSYEVQYVVDPAGTLPPARSATIVVEPSQFVNTPTWFPINTPLHFTASASGGAAPYQFKWWMSNGSGWHVLHDWTETTTMTWTPTSAGVWTAAVWARSHGVTQDARQALGQVGGRILTGNEIEAPSTGRLTSNLASPQRVGTSIAFTSSAQGGVAPLQFKWWLSDATGWRMLRDWSSSPTFTWTPTNEGTYLIATWARSNGETTNLGDVLAQVSYRVDPLVSVPPVTGASLTPNVASPQVPGTPVTFTAAATGGQTPAEFKWWLWNGTDWSVLRDWSATPALTWSPSSAGTYRVAIWARSSGVTADARQALAQLDYRIDTAAPISPVTGVTLVSNAASPQDQWTPITFTATATGGVPPAAFKWWIQVAGGAWYELRDWSSNPTYTWNPRYGGSYMIAVWARSSGTTEDARQALAQVTYFIR